MAALWQGWMLVRPKPFPLDARCRVVAVQAAGRLAEKIPRPSAGKPTMVVSRFEGDPTGDVTDAVRRAVDRVGGYAVQPTTVLQNILRESGIEQEPLAPEAATSVDFKKLGTSYLLAGRVGALYARSDEDKAVLEAVLVAADGSSQPVRFSAEASRDQRQSAATLAVRSYPWPARLVSWLAVTLLLPLALAPLARRGLEKESSAVNLGMLLGLTLLSGLAAYAMMGFQLETALSAALLIGAAGVACAYSWALLSRIEDWRN